MTSFDWVLVVSLGGMLVGLIGIVSAAIVAGAGEDEDEA